MLKIYKKNGNNGVQDTFCAHNSYAKLGQDYLLHHIHNTIIAPTLSLSPASNIISPVALTKSVEARIRDIECTISHVTITISASPRWRITGHCITTSSLSVNAGSHGAEKLNRPLALSLFNTENRSYVYIIHDKRTCYNIQYNKYILNSCLK